LDGYSSCCKTKVGKRKDFIKTEDWDISDTTVWIKDFATLMSQCTMIILAQSMEIIQLLVLNGHKLKLFALGELIKIFT
jgi:hypothetical protein